MRAASDATDLPALKAPQAANLVNASNRNVLARITAERVLHAVLSRKLIFILGCVASLSVAYVSAKFFSKKTWETETTLVYSPLPVSGEGKDLYVPPDLKTLSALVNSPAILEKVRAEFAPELPAKVIQLNLAVTIPNGTKVLKLTFKWDTGEKSAEMLNRLTDVFVDTVAEMRKEKLQSHIGDFDATLKRVQDRLGAASQEVQAFHHREHLSDYKADLAEAGRLIIANETEIATKRREESDVLAQMKRMTEYLEEVKATEAKEAEKTREYEAANESITDSRRRQDRIREIIEEERRGQEIRAQIDVKQIELDRVMKLVARRAASLSELELLQAEIAGLKSKINENVKITNLRKELEKIDKVVVPQGAKKSMGSPIIQQVMFRKLELELQLTATRNQIAQLQAGVEARRQQIERLDKMQNEYESLTRKVEAINAERERVEAQIAGLRNVQGLKAAEFVVASRAEPGEYPTASNTKVLLAGLGGVGMMGTLALLVALEFLCRDWTCEARARQLGLPPLGLIAPAGQPARGQDIRGVALRIRQFLPAPGAAVVFSTLSEACGLDDTIEELAALLALRDERVLILDARVAHNPPRSKQADAIMGIVISELQDQPAAEILRLSENLASGSLGLSDYLAFHCSNPDDICHPGGSFGVDVIPTGQADVPSDSLATHRMAELMAKLQLRYSILLVLGPSLAHAVDVQILAAMSQAVVAVVDAPVPIRRDVRRTLADLRELGAPILGQLIFCAPS